MSQPIDHENCLRRKMVIFCENWYMTMGKRFVHFTTPYENRPEKEKERAIMEEIGRNLTELLELLNPEDDEQ